MHVVRAPVLVVEVVGVFPDIDRQQRFDVLGQRVIGIARLGNTQIRAIEEQPRPA